MGEIAHRFDDGAGYERFMGRWSRAAGAVFLEWMTPPITARWLDVGCGTGVFTRLVLDRCAPANMVGIDPATSLIEHARSQSTAEQAEFRVADAQALPFPDSTFDVVASALVLNFVPDQGRALSEMRRVTRAGGIVACYVWDFSAERSPSWPLRLAMRHIGVDVPAVPGSDSSGIGSLVASFETAGFQEITSLNFEVSVSFSTFAAFWHSQMPSYSPITEIISALTDYDREKLMAAVRAMLPVNRNGNIEYSARSNAIMARVPSPSVDDKESARQTMMQFQRDRV